MKCLDHLFSMSLILLGMLIPLQTIQADCGDEADLPLSFNQLFIGPEIYYVKRTREGGAEQTGGLYGVRGGYEYIRRYALYVGLEGLYATGTLNGKSGEGERVKSWLTDANVEGRMGYTFQSKSCYHFSFTPFIGAGYFWENNHYIHPSPLHIHFDNSFWYVPVGFLSSFYVSSQLSLGLNFKARFPMDGYTKTSHDPDESDHQLHYEHKVQYRVELPIAYYACWCNSDWALTLIPFYEYRQYGHKPNYPFDFLETTFKLYGVNLRISYLF